MSLLRATRASHSASPDGRERTPTLVTFGPTSSGLLARYHPRSSFSRTYLITLPSDLMLFEQTYEEWATLLRQASLARRRLARHTSGSASSSWPSSRAEDSESCGNHPGSGGDSLTGAVRSWATPQAHDEKNPRDVARAEDRGRSRDLSDDAIAWSTPRAADSITGHQHPETLEARKLRNGGGIRNLCHDTAAWLTPTTSDEFGARELDGKRSGGLNTQAFQWHTPTTNPVGWGVDGRTKIPHLNLLGQAKQAIHQEPYPTPSATPYGSSHNGIRKNDPSAARPGLESMAAKGMFPTPAARDGKGANSEEHVTATGSGKRHMDQLPNFIAHTPSGSSPRDQTTATDGSSSSSATRVLNPRFVEMLMGWPIGWTDSGAAVTGFTQYRQLWRSFLFGVFTSETPSQ